MTEEFLNIGGLEKIPTPVVETPVVETIKKVVEETKVEVEEEVKPYGDTQFGQIGL